MPASSPSKGRGAHAVAEHFASIAETGQGIPGLRAKAASVLEPAQYDDFVARENRAQRTFGVIDSIRTAPPEEVAAKVASLKPQSGSTFAEEARTFDQVAHAADQMMKAREANPAGYVIRTVPAVCDAYQAAQETPGLLPGVIPQLLAGQTAMGLAPDKQRILPDPHGDAARIAAMPAAEVPGAIDTLREQYGKYWARARDELVEAGLPAPYVVLGTLDEPHVTVARTELTAALTTGYTALAKSIDPQQRTDIAGALDAVRWDQETTRGAGEPTTYRYAAEGRLNPALESERAPDVAPAQSSADPADGTASDGSDEVTPATTDPNTAPQPLSSAQDDVVPGSLGEVVEKPQYAGYVVPGGRPDPKLAGDFRPVSMFQSRTPTEFKDDYGKPILKLDLKPMLRPTDVDPSFFVRAGLAAKNAPLLMKRAFLVNFDRGGPWDVQRVGEERKYMEEFVDFATVAIGLYGAAAGIPIEEMLEWEDLLLVGLNFAKEHVLIVSILIFREQMFTIQCWAMICIGPAGFANA